MNVVIFAIEALGAILLVGILGAALIGAVIMLCDIFKTEYYIIKEWFTKKP